MFYRAYFNVKKILKYILLFRQCGLLLFYIEQITINIINYAIIVKYNML